MFQNLPQPQGAKHLLAAALILPRSRGREDEPRLLRPPVRAAIAAATGSRCSVRLSRMRFLLWADSELLSSSAALQSQLLR